MDTSRALLEQITHVALMTAMMASIDLRKLCPKERGHSIECDGRSACGGFVVNECVDAAPYQSPGAAKHIRSPISVHTAAQWSTANQQQMR